MKYQMNRCHGVQYQLICPRDLIWSAAVSSNMKTFLCQVMWEEVRISSSGGSFRGPSLPWTKSSFRQAQLACYALVVAE